MKKLSFLRKMILMTALLFVGTSAWATDVPYNVGSSTSDAWKTYFSDVWEMTGDGTLTVTFTNHCATTGNNWENWLLYCGNSEVTTASANDAFHFVMRSDRWDDKAGSNAGFIVGDDYFTDFKTFQNEATITLKIVRSGSTVNVFTSVTKDATTKSMTYVKTGLEGTLKFFLTQNLSYMTVTAQNLSTNIAGETMTNAYFSFTDATITSNTIYGEVGSMSWSGQWTPTPSIDSNMFRVGNMYSGTVALIGEAAGSKDIVTISFDLGAIELNKKSCEFLVTDINSLVLVDEEFNLYSSTFTDGKNTLGLVKSDFTTAKSDDPGMSACKNSITLTFNYLTRKISFTNNGTVNKQIDMPAAAAAVASFGVRSNYNFEQRRCYFDNLLIQTEIGDYAAVTTTYTVKYKSGEEEIKDAATGRVGNVGDAPVLEASDTETFYSADGSKKYIYASDDASTTTIVDGGTTVVTVNFAEYEKRTYTLNAVDKANNETVLSELGTGYVYADAPSVTINTPWYILYSGTLYNVNGNSTTFNVESNGFVKTLEYTATDITNVAYYSEGENMANRTHAITYSVASNKGIARFTDGDAVFTSLGVGSYHLYARVHVGNTNGGTLTLKAGETTFASKTFGNGNNQSLEADFALTGTTDLKIDYYAGNASGLDYLYIVKTSDTPSIPKSMTSAGWATFCSPYALDFSSSIANLTDVYIVTGATGSTLNLTSVKGGTVAANTGILLQGTAGTITIPVVASGTDYSSTNKLKGVTSATAKDENSIYVLMGSPAVGFYKNAEAFTVGANTAYLNVSDFSFGSAREFFLIDETTGINQVETVKLSVEGYYNLNGQRVAQPTKGLYIVNGKKVVIK